MAVHTKVVLVVSRTHWRCLSCKVFSKKTESIDQHLKEAHERTDFSLKQKCSKNISHVHSYHCYSDSELDCSLHKNQIFHAYSVPFSAVKEELVLDTVSCVNNPGQSASEQFSKCMPRNPKQKRKKKTAHVRLKKHCVYAVDSKSKQLPVLSKDSVPDNCEIPGSENKEEKEAATEQTHESKEDGEKRNNRRTSRSISAPKKSVSEQRKTCAQHLGLQKNRNRRQIEAEKTLPLIDTLKDKPDFIIPQTLGRPTKKTRAKKSSNDRNNEVPEQSTALKEEPSNVFKECVHTAQSLKESDSVRIRHTRKPRKSYTVCKSSELIDKSKIATSCVPWLLDSGRRAGEKVTKRSRRLLLAEEKKAVRELYGLLFFEQERSTQALRVSENVDRQTAVHIPSTNISQFSSHQLKSSGQQVIQEEDVTPSHQNYLMNMYSQGSRDFVLDGSHTHDRVFPHNAGVYSQQQPQHPNYVTQTSDVYSSVHHFSSHRSNVMNFQAYGQNIPAIPTGAGSNLEQVFSVTNSAYTPEILAPGNLVSHLVSSNIPSLVNAKCNTSNDLVNSCISVPSSSSSKSMTDSSMGMKSDSSEHQQSHTVVSDPPNHYKTTIPDNNSKGQCRPCEQRSRNTDEFQKHQNNAYGFKSIKCKRCSHVFHNLHELNLHVFSLHEVEKQAFCFTCNQDMNGMEDLEKHVHNHAYSSALQLSDMRFHDCRLCGEELNSSYTTVRTHYYQHHVAHVCNDCYGVFEDILAYRQHSKSHEGRQVVCSICGFKFESAEDLAQHSPCPEDIWAEDGKGEQCYKCGLWCPNRAVVEAHKKQHRSQEDVESYRQGAKIGFPCVFCEKVFKNKHACRRHIKMIHEGVSCYKHYCEYCGKGFLTKGHMHDHIALHHLKIKRYKCDYCNKQFVCGPTLRRHVRKEHTKHKPYQCQHCGERFFEKTPLQRHLTQHTGLAPFMCEHCGKGFYTKHSFTNHGSTHSTVKEFVCSGCQKGFTRKYNLHAHIKICKSL